MVDPIQDKRQDDTSDIWKACSGNIPKVGTAAFTSRSLELEDAQGNAIVDRPDVIQVCPWFLELFSQKGFNRPDDAIAKAASSSSKVKELYQRMRGRNTPIDTLALFDMTILHELTHTRQSGMAEDISPAGISSKLDPYSSAYGYMNAVKLKTPDNAGRSSSQSAKEPSTDIPRKLGLHGSMH